MKKLNAFGFVHHVLPVITVVAIAAIGTYAVISHAATANQTLTAYSEYGKGKSGNFNPGHFSVVAGSARLTYQKDGNLVFYQGSKAYWATGTQGKSANAHLQLYQNGNVIIWQHTSSGWHVLWQSHTGYGTSVSCFVYNPYGQGHSKTVSVSGLYRLGVQQRTGNPRYAKLTINALYKKSGTLNVWSQDTNKASSRGCQLPY